jgi:hypothetical protein
MKPASFKARPSSPDVGRRRIHGKEQSACLRKSLVPLASLLAAQRACTDLSITASRRTRRHDLVGRTDRCRKSAVDEHCCRLPPAEVYTCRTA